MVRRMRTLLLALRALVYMTGFLFVFGWIARRVRAFDGSLGVLPAWSPSLGIVLAVAGGLVVLACAGVFIVRGRGTPAVFDPPREFVAVGPYKYVRNPMYIGGLTLLVGFGLYERSVAILVLCVVLLLAVHGFVVFFEEPQLRARFSAGYEQYCRDVRRWVPRLRR